MVADTTIPYYIRPKPSAHCKGDNFIISRVILCLKKKLYACGFDSRKNFCYCMKTTNFASWWGIMGCSWLTQQFLTSNIRTKPSAHYWFFITNRVTLSLRSKHKNVDLNPQEGDWFCFLMEDYSCQLPCSIRQKPADFIKNHRGVSEGRALGGGGICPPPLFRRIEGASSGTLLHYYLHYYLSLQF